ncbi:MAG: S8 family serine peptidase [Pseudobdellovibrionaceae bacterium]|nr:S8 family serine peptidase [Bdellovibrionales bacterium]USN48716.1 MAG: S8 family serine peptidase [Pseudobdellovibrionaceae bacterium]
MAVQQNRVSKLEISIVLIFTTIMLSAGGCKAPEPASSDSGSGGGGASCEVSASAVVASKMPGTNLHGKVQLDKFLLGQSPQAGALQKGSQAFVPAGTRLSMAIDRACASQPENASGFFSHEIQASLVSQPSLQIHAKKVIYSSLELHDAHSVAELEDLADQDPCLLKLGVDMQLKTTAVFSDPLAINQAHLSSIGYSSAYDGFFGANGITGEIVVAVIDTGMELTHPDLSANVWVNTSEVDGDSIDNDGNGYVDDVNGYNFVDNDGDPTPITTSGPHDISQHGTMVAGLLAARSNNSVGVVGIMGTNVKIMALNVFGDQEGSNLSDVDEAIQYAVDNGADVINLSLGAQGTSVTTQMAIQNAVSSGVVVLAATGNSYLHLSPSVWMTPASYAVGINGMISVGANYSDSKQITYYSNYSSDYVELAAPGSETYGSSGNEGLLTTANTNMYARVEGTSMSSPVAAGAAALTIGLIRARGGSPTPAQVESLLIGSATRVDGLVGYVKGCKSLNASTLYNQVNLQYPAP